MNVKKGTFKPCPSGWQRLVIVDNYDMMITPKKGKNKEPYQAAFIVCESEKLMEDGRPYLINFMASAWIRYSSDGKPSKLLAFIGDIYGKMPYKNNAEIPDEGLDLDKLIGKSFYASVVQQGDYANINAATTLPPGQVKLEMCGKYVRKQDRKEAEPQSESEGRQDGPFDTNVPPPATKSDDDDLPF